MKALDTGNNNTVCHYLGPMNVVCSHCQALHFAGELQSCCKNGPLTPVLFPKLLQLEDIPQIIKDLFDGHSKHSAEFFDNIRFPNGQFSLTSFGISSNLSRDQAIQTNSDSGGFSLVIHGQLYHLISPLVPRSGTAPTYSQMLFFDSHFEELERRQEVCEKNKVIVSKELLELIQRELHRINRLYKNYKAVGMDGKLTGIQNDTEQDRT